MKTKMKIVAPKNSAAHKALLEVASKSGAITVEHLQDMLWRINAHWNLTAFLIVCTNLREILRLIESESEDALLAWGIDIWLPVLDWILETSWRTTLIETIGPWIDKRFDLDKHNPMLGEGAERHALYTALCNSHPRPELCMAYQRMQAYLLLAHVSAMGKVKTATLEIYESYDKEEGILRHEADPYLAMIAGRYLSQPDPIAESILVSIFESLSEEEFGARAFVNALDKVRPTTAKNANRIDAVARFLRKGLGIERQGEKRGGGNKRGGSPRVHGGTGTDTLLNEYGLPEDDPGDDTTPPNGKHTVRTRSTRTAAERRALLDLDDYPNDEDDDDSLLDSDYGDDPKDPGKHVAAASSAARYIDIANQDFRWYYGFPAVSEIVSIVLTPLQKFNSITSASSLSQSELDELEFHALLQTMFYTSSSIKRARSLRLFGSADAEFALIAGAEDRVPRWRSRAPLPRYAPQPAVDNGIDRKRTEYVELPDVADGSRLVRLLIQTRKLAKERVYSEQDILLTAKETTRIFRKPLEWYRAKLNQWLEENNLTGRLTEGRIAGFLKNRLIAESGADLVAVSIAIGQELPRAKVRIFYACPSESRLQKLYSSTTSRVLADAASAAGMQVAVKSYPAIAESDFYVGNRINPNKGAFIGAVRRLKEDLKRWHNPRNDEDLRRYHNTYTFWTIWAFQVASSWRGTATPYVDLTEVDEYSGLFVISDKDGGTGYKDRPEWLPLEMVEHMGFYKEFINESPNRHKAPPEWPCFFLDEKLDPIEVRPKTIKPIMDRYLPVAQNIHRRFIASELLEMGLVEAECLWSGHWFRGEEPWGPMSTYSFASHVRIVKQFLHPLWRELGFRSIRAFSDFKI
jgi:hypothetical protein